ncbi:MAG TPA: hypothetical protein VH437_17050 [Terriglobales bacterium]|jgi:hypothetical protein
MDNRTWQELCQAIMQEQDPIRLMDLVHLLNRALEDRERHLRATGGLPNPSPNEQ